MCAVIVIIAGMYTELMEAVRKTTGHFSFKKNINIKRKTIPIKEVLS